MKSFCLNLLGVRGGIMIKKVSFFVALFVCFHGYLNYKIDQDCKQKKILLAAVAVKQAVPIGFSDLLKHNKTGKHLVAHISKRSTASCGHMA